MKTTENDKIEKATTTVDPLEGKTEVNQEHKHSTTKTTVGTIEQDKIGNNRGDKRDDKRWIKAQTSKECTTNFWKRRDKTTSGEYILSRPPKKPGEMEVFDNTKYLGLGNNGRYRCCTSEIFFLLVWFWVIWRLCKKVRYLVQKRKEVFPPDNLEMSGPGDALYGIQSTMKQQMEMQESPSEEIGSHLKLKKIRTGTKMPA